MRLVFRRYGGTRVMSLPAMMTSPESGVSRPARIFRRVDLPLPLGPRRVKNSPSRTSSEIPFSAFTSPGKVFVKLRIRTRVSAATSSILMPPSAAAARALVEKGAAWADGPQHVAEKSDVVITMLEDARAVREVLLGAEGVVAARRPNLRIIDMSTISPKDSRDIARQVASRGMIMIDSPVSGSVKAAADASLTLLVGGDPEVVESVLPVLRAMGKNVFHLGPNGMGCYMQLVNNLVLAASLAGFSEAFVLGKKAGLPPQQMLDVILQGSARSPLLEFKGKAIVDRNFAPTFALRLMRKDLGLALETGSQTQVPMPITAFLNELHQAAIAGGLADRDWSAIVQVFEGLAGVS